MDNLLAKTRKPSVVASQPWWLNLSCMKSRQTLFRWQPALLNTGKLSERKAHQRDGALSAQVKYAEVLESRRSEGENSP
ncbi:hypothetical protein M407DRAFT_29618 [Tulasnella calospora MUT 4182]|uniref:Uncharacterized protein n=1 Tax=Tulasnella calospora MUT 4182 TaxID=1051891 RepID=A0A0C3LH54_9AGAM|nr:hypothetical protein M407DRAFT_29618 [Tulasnella calospora MUT 4182]